MDSRFKGQNRLRSDLFQRHRAHMPKASLASLTLAFSFVEAQGTGGTDR